MYGNDEPLVFSETFVSGVRVFISPRLRTNSLTVGWFYGRRRGRDRPTKTRVAHVSANRARWRLGATGTPRDVTGWQDDVTGWQDARVTQPMAVRLG